MSILKQSLSALVICTFVLFSCKGDASNIKDKAKEIAEESSESISEGISKASEKASDVAEDVTEVISETVEQADEKIEEVKTIVAPPANNKPKENTKYTNTNNSESSNPKPGSSNAGSNSDEVVFEDEVHEESSDVVTEKPSPTTKPSKVLKEIEKPSNAGTKEKVEVGKITKPQSTTTTKTKIENSQTEFGHAPFNTILKKVVSSSGAVDYKLLKANQQDLENYCKSLEDNAPASSWTRNEKLAYWLNAYNAYTLKLIIDNYPVNSIMDLDGGKPWDRKWINLDSKSLSLNDIENEIIRPTFNDARIHFAVNCAAKSCPPLANYAFTARNVDSKMEALTKSFINSSFNEITADKIVVSKIFDWYSKDFGNLIDFINKYSDVKVNDKAKVKFQEYDWNLNGK